jgi:phenylpropionate dioxygenase-like ring-hydroxylating dioxygenase large terminal subunit
MTDLRRVGISPDFWYPLARSGSVKKGKTLAVTFAGTPIVLFRTPKGEVHALEDRCAHRQMPLSLGVVQGEALKCSYHAWTYRRDGAIAGIPYLPKGAVAPTCVRAYACREAYDHVFVFPGDPVRAGAVPLPELPYWGHPGYKTMYFSREVRCHYSFMHENLMDMNHQFLHRGILGMIKPTLVDTKGGSTWVEARYRFEHAGGKKHRGAAFLGDQGTGGEDILTIRSAYPYQRLRLDNGGAEPAFTLFAAYVPLDREQRRNRSFGLLTIRKPWFPGLVHLIWPFMRRFTEKVFTEDRMAVEAEQAAWERQERDENHEVFPVILELRDLLEKNGVPLRAA